MHHLSAYMKHEWIIHTYIIPSVSQLSTSTAFQSLTLFLHFGLVTSTRFSFPIWSQASLRQDRLNSNWDSSSKAFDWVTVNLQVVQSRSHLYKTLSHLPSETVLCSVLFLHKSRSTPRCKSALTPSFQLLVKPVTYTAIFHFFSFVFYIKLYCSSFPSFLLLLLLLHFLLFHVDYLCLY